MTLLSKIFKRNSEKQEERIFKLDTLGLIFPEDNYIIYRPEFVVMDKRGEVYDSLEYKHLNGKRCKKYSSYSPGVGNIRSPKYLAKRFLDIITNIKLRPNSLLHNEDELELDKCPLYFYILNQLKENPNLIQRDIQIPMQVINETYMFLDEKVREYNQERTSIRNAIFNND